MLATRDNIYSEERTQSDGVNFIKANCFTRTFSPNQSKIINFGSNLKMLSKVLRPTNKQVSKIKDQRMHLRSVNNTRINSISPSNKIEDGFDFIKTCNIPFSPNQSIRSNPKRNKIDVKIRFKNDRLRSADISLDGNTSIKHTT